MPDNDNDKQSPLNIFMGFVNAIAGDIDYQQLNEIVEEGRREWEEQNG